MYQGKERREAASVRDIPVELWIKIIGGLMAILVSLGAWFGVWIGKNIESMADNIAVIASGVKVNEAEIGNLKGTVLEIKTDHRKLHDKVYTLEGEFKSWKKQ